MARSPVEVIPRRAQKSALCQKGKARRGGVPGFLIICARKQRGADSSGLPYMGTPVSIYKTGVLRRFRRGNEDRDFCQVDLRSTIDEPKKRHELGIWAGHAESVWGQPTTIPVRGRLVQFSQDRTFEPGRRRGPPQRSAACNNPRVLIRLSRS